MNTNPEYTKIPKKITMEFQDIVNLLVEVLGVPAALILKFDPPEVEVLCAGGTGSNPYKAGDRIPVGDRFREEILTAEEGLGNFPIDRGMVSYLGDVLLNSSQEVFGIICVMDSQENHFNTLSKKLLSRFKKEVETLLQLHYFEAASIKKGIDPVGTREKLESVGILAGGIAQDFNSLLSVIIGNISLARMEVPPGEKVYDLLLESEKASCQAADIAEKLITFSEGGWLVRREERLETIFKELKRVGALEPGIFLDIRLPFNLSSIFVDEGQFKQVLLNVFSNAADAVSEGDKVSVTAEDIIVEAGDIPTLKPGEYIKLSIEDRGMGIPKKYMGKIFDPYFSTKDSLTVRGMGLGLSICYSIIKKHEGWINVESEEGVGTTVHLYIPVYNQENLKEPLNV